MAKKKKAKKKSNGHGPQEANASQDRSKLKRKLYEKELEKLQVELVRLQAWVKHSGARIVVVFEGRDAAGKGGIIKRIVERVSGWAQVARHDGWGGWVKARNLQEL